MNARLFLSTAVLALSATFACAQETVNFTMKASMPSLRDPKANDTFIIGIADKQVETSLNVKCQAATSGMISGRNESCAVTGTGALINPTNGKKLQRTQYAGGWILKGDGFTDGSNLKTNYLALGKVAASDGSFGGSMMLKPENPSTGASLLRDTVMKKLKAKDAGLIDQRVDTIQFNNFTTPSAGLPSDKGCVWNGDMVYAYQTESWFIDIAAKCSGKEFKLKGNMPFTLTPNVGNQHQYDLVMTLPTEANTDEALFTAPAGDQDLFAAADGITGQILMKESGYVDVEVDGDIDKLATEIDATGSFTGTGVPIETVRSFATIVGILARGFFGA
jgi:hypothetical protein